MTRRTLLRYRRYPSLTVFVVGIPLVLLLLFVYVFGGAFGAGVASGVAPGHASRAAYLAYITPAMVIFALVGAGQSTAIGVAMDATSGIMARFRTMDIAPGSVLGGPVVGAVIQSVAAAIVVLGVSVALGYRPSASPLGWLALLGVVALAALALTWLTVAMGLSARTVEGASNTPMILLLLAFLSSAFAPLDTMPTPVRVFAENQPLTPIIESVRGLLSGDVAGATVLKAVAWCVVLGLLGYLWARSLYRRERAA